jgi:hypothetical protein
MLFQLQRLYIISCGEKFANGTQNDFEGNGYGLFHGVILEFASSDCENRENPKPG